MAAGDFDTLTAMLSFYNSYVPFAQARTQAWYNHSGLFFPETMTVFGGYTEGWFGFGCDDHSAHPNRVSNTYMRYHREGGLELAAFVLDHFAMTGDGKTLSSLLPLLDGLVTFYAEHYPQRDSTGRLVLAPGQALETWQCEDDVSSCVTNNLPEVAGLHAVLPRLLALPHSVTTTDQRRRWVALRDILPDVPMGPCLTKTESTCLLAGAVLPKIPSNSENAELYAAHPFRLYGQFLEGVELARETFARRLFPCNEGWCQDVMQAALLGAYACCLHVCAFVWCVFVGAGGDSVYMPSFACLFVCGVFSLPACGE